MARLGSVDLLVFGFDGAVALPSGVRRQVDDLGGRGNVRILDVLYVSHDDEGIVRVERHGDELHAPRAAPSVLWRLLANDAESEPPPTTLLDDRRGGDVGLDLIAIEGLARSIERGTTALLMLVETMWDHELLDAVLTSGGFPILFGRLEPETMLVVGPDLAAASSAARAEERAAAARGAALLDELGIPGAKATLTALVEARLIVDSDVAEAVDALKRGGIVP